MTSRPLRYGRDASARVAGIYRTPEIEAQRRRCLDLLGVRPGERVLDLGCGPGLLAVELAAAVTAAGEVIAVDISEEMLALTTEAAQRAEVSLRVRREDATALSLPDHSIDAAIAVQTLAFVPAVDAALAELARVLRPGGRLLVLDTDWSALAWSSERPDRLAAFVAAWSSATAWPSLPRTIESRLTAAGFVDLAMTTLPISAGRWDPDGYVVRQIGHMAATILERAALAPAEVEAVLAEQRALARTGGFSFRLERTIVIGRRPEVA